MQTIADALFKYKKSKILWFHLSKLKTISAMHSSQECNH